MKKFFGHLLLILGAPLVPCLGQHPIAIDGDAGDWSNVPILMDAGDVEAGFLDIQSLQVTNDAQHLFLRLVFNTEIDLTDVLVDQGLRLYLDTDMEASTGYALQAGFGSELGVFFSDLMAFYDVEPATTVALADFGFVPGPTVTSNWFEMAISRDAVPDGITPLFSQAEIRLVVREANGGDEVPGFGEAFTYTFQEGEVSEPDPIDIARPPLPHIRCTAYNVLANGLQDSQRQPHFERVIQAIDADIFGFSECGNTSVATVKGLLDEWLPTETAAGWHVVKSGDLVTASIWPITATWTNVWKQFPVLIQPDVDPEIDEEPALAFINAHLSCCGADDSRQAQIDELIAFILDAKTAGGEVDWPANTPVLYAGDLNLVGWSQQLETVITGGIVDVASFGTGAPPDWDETDWLDVHPRQTDARLSYTWRDDPNSYPPGRLDFIFASDAVLTIQKSFVIQTEVMPEERLVLYGLEEQDTGTASDHFPVTADVLPTALVDHVPDFSVGAPTASPFELFPNPASDVLLFRLDVEASLESSVLFVRIHDLQGRLIHTTACSGAETFVDVAGLAEGSYLVHLASPAGRCLGSATQLMIVR